MSYVRFEEKSAAQREADRKANEEWMRSHPPVNESPTMTVYSRGFGSHVASAH
jgi:hypothetical protein